MTSSVWILEGCLSTCFPDYTPGLCVSVLTISHRHCECLLRSDSHTALHIFAYIRTTLSEQSLINGLPSTFSLLVLSSHSSDDREDTFSMVSLNTALLP